MKNIRNERTDGQRRRKFYLSRCYTLKLLAETCVQRHREQVSQRRCTQVTAKSFNV